MMPPKMFHWLPWSCLRYLILFFAAAGICQASNKSVIVDLCQNSAQRPPCKEFEVPLESNKKKCVNVKRGYKGKVSSVYVKPAQSNTPPFVCRFYSQKRCTGKCFDVDQSAVDMTRAPATAINNKVASYSCYSPQAPKPRPEWNGPDTKQRLCSRLNEVKFTLTLSNAESAGTWDTISLVLGVNDDIVQTVAVEPVTLAAGPAAGASITKYINLKKTFGLNTISLDQIGYIQLFSLKTAGFGSDQWRIKGLMLRGQCAETGIPVLVYKYSSLDKAVKINRYDDYQKEHHNEKLGYPVWVGKVTEEDWTPLYRCNQIHKLRVIIHIADEEWAGTSNTLFIEVANVRKRVADETWRAKSYSATLYMDDVPASSLKSIKIETNKRHDDQTLIKVGDSDFDFNFSADEEKLLIQLAADAETKDSVATTEDENDLAAQNHHSDNTTAAALLFEAGGKSSNRLVVKLSSDGSEKTDAAAAEDAAKLSPPVVSEDFEDEFSDDGRSPLQRFRSYPQRALTVSDLISGAWCELQYWYTLSRLPGGRRTRTAAMRQGSKIHQKLEDEVHTTVVVQILTKEDDFGLKLWNLIHGLRTLRETGLTREVPIWGIVDGNVVHGVIDSLSHENPNPEFEPESESEPSQKPKKRKTRQKTKITDYLASSKSVETKRTGPKVYLADVKTTGSAKKKSSSFARPAQIQLLLYHRFLSDLAAGSLDFGKVLDRYGFDSNRAFSDGFLAQLVSLHDEATDDETASSSRETRETSDGDAEPAASAVAAATATAASEALKHNDLTKLLGLVRQEVELTFPEGQGSVGKTLRVQYIYRKDGREIDHQDFAASRAVLDEYLRVYMAWWRGERRALGVGVHEAYKCHMCEFAEVCRWRKEMESKQVAQARERMQAADRKVGAAEADEKA